MLQHKHRQRKSQAQNIYLKLSLTRMRYHAAFSKPLSVYLKFPLTLSRFIALFGNASGNSALVIEVTAWMEANYEGAYMEYDGTLLVTDNAFGHHFDGSSGCSSYGWGSFKCRCRQEMLVSINQVHID